MVVWLTKEDFREHKQYVIKCAGTYKLKENISFCSKKNKTSAILIDSDNVILDLNGKELRQSKHNKFSQITGIIVKTGHYNTTILGSYGIIKNFSQRGIYVEGGNKLVTIGDQTSLTVSGCGYGTPVAFQDGEENIIQGGIQLGEMVFLVKAGWGTYNGLLETVKLVNVTSTKNSFGGSLGEGSGYSFENCSYSDNFDYRIINNIVSTLGGFIVPNSVLNYGLVYFSNPSLDTPELSSFGITDVLFENCSFNRNMADGTNPTEEVYPSGAYCDSFFIGANFRGLKIKNCQFNSNETRLNDVNGFVNNTRGCVLSSGSGTVVEDSEFINNLGGRLVNGLNVTGLIAAAGATSRDNFPAKSTTIRNCVASRNRAVVNAPAQEQIESIGFSLRYPSGLSLINCVSEDNTSEDNTPQGINSFCDGILIFSDPCFPTKFSNNIEVVECKSSRNRVTRGFLGSSSGIRILDDLCENIVIQDSVFTNNWLLIDDGPKPDDYFIVGAGIDLFNESVSVTGPSYVSVLNNVVQSNNDFGIFSNLDLTNIQGNKVVNHLIGIELTGVEITPCDPEEPKFFRNNCSSSILDNTVLSNSSGISDLSDPSTSLVGNNKVFNSTPGFDYSVYYGPGGTDPVPVARGSLNAYPELPIPGIACINVSIEGAGQCEYPPSCPPCPPETEVLNNSKSKQLVPRKLVSKQNNHLVYTSEELTQKLAEIRALKYNLRKH